MGRLSRLIQQQRLTRTVVALKNGTSLRAYTILKTGCPVLKGPEYCCSDLVRHIVVEDGREVLRQVHLLRDQQILFILDADGFAHEDGLFLRVLCGSRQKLLPLRLRFLAEQHASHVNTRNPMRLNVHPDVAHVGYTIRAERNLDAIYVVADEWHFNILASVRTRPTECGDLLELQVHVLQREIG